jgi:hypothetical protein
LNLSRCSSEETKRKQTMANEFLPICDNLFNVISLAAYFCDCVFDIVLGYALLERGRINFFIAVVFIIGGSLIVSQVSFEWRFCLRLD